MWAEAKVAYKEADRPLSAGTALVPQFDAVPEVSQAVHTEHLWKALRHHLNTSACMSAAGACLAVVVEPHKMLQQDSFWEFSSEGMWGMRQRSST